MVISRTGVSGVAHVPDDRALLYELLLRDPRGPGLQVCVIEEVPLVGADLVNRDAAGHAIVKFDDLPICYRDNRGSGWGDDVNCVVRSPFRSGIVVGVR